MTSKSNEKISKSLDTAMDKASSPEGDLIHGISIRNGPMEEMEIDGPAKSTKTNGASTGKRKSRQSLTNGKSYKESSSDAEEDDKPLVWP